MKPAALLLAVAAAGALSGCSGSSGTVSAHDEELYKHPQKVDPSKIPQIKDARKGPAFFGTATVGTASRMKNSAPPAGTTAG